MSDKLRNLIVRTLSGAVLLAIVVAASFLGLKGFTSLLLVIIAIGVEEFYTLAKAKGANPQQILGIITSLSLFATSCHLGFRAMKPCESELVNTMLMVSALVALLGFALIFVAEVFRNKENPTLNIASTVTGIVYVALPLSLMFYVPLLLAYIGGGALEWNPLIFLFYLFIVWGNDVFAYLVGITLGRHKMCERLSPKKSWEGFVGGVIGDIEKIVAYGICALYFCRAVDGRAESAGNPRIGNDDKGSAAFKQSLRRLIVLLHVIFHGAVELKGSAAYEEDADLVLYIGSLKQCGRHVCEGADGGNVNDLVAFSCYADDGVCGIAFNVRAGLIDSVYASAVDGDSIMRVGKGEHLDYLVVAAVHAQLLGIASVVHIVNCVHGKKLNAGSEIKICYCELVVYFVKSISVENSFLYSVAFKIGENFINVHFLAPLRCSQVLLITISRLIFLRYIISWRVESKA